MAESPGSKSVRSVSRKPRVSQRIPHRISQAIGWKIIEVSSKPDSTKNQFSWTSGKYLFSCILCYSEKRDMEYSVTSLITDIAFMSLLIFTGQILRAKIKIIQKLFARSFNRRKLGSPPLLGPEGLAVLPFSSALSNYPTR